MTELASLTEAYTKIQKLEKKNEKLLSLIKKYDNLLRRLPHPTKREEFEEYAKLLQQSYVIIREY